MPPRPTSPSNSSPVVPCDPCGESQHPEAPWIPESKLPPLPNDSIMSFVRKILLASPEFPRLYADLILHTSPNSNEAKILRPHYQKLFEKVNLMSNQNGTCTHIKVTGVRCGSPALKGQQFCYFHQNAIRSVRRPKQSRLHPIALIEDEESIQYALMEVINALMKNTIDLKRATLILRALHIAVKNAARVKFALQGKNAVSQVPNFVPPPDNADFDETTEIDLPYNAWVPQKSERQIMEEKARAQKLQDWKAQQAQIRADLERARTDVPASVRAHASVRPASEASVPAAESATTTKNVTAATPIPPHNFQPPHLPSATSVPIPRKPPVPAKTTSKVAKNKPHPASHG